MQRHKEAGAIRADLMIAVVLTAAVLGLGVFLGAALFGKPTAAPPQPTESARMPVPPEGPAPTLRGAALPDDIGTRLTAVEKAVEALRASQAQATDQIRPIVEAYDSLKRDGAFVPGGSPAAAIPMVPDSETTGDGAHKLARALGLDPARREAMASQLAQTLSELETIEKAHAEVTHDGPVTTIKIGKYGDQASEAMQRWRDWIDRNLTPREKEAYERAHSESQLIGLRAGLFDRTIRIDETGGAIQFKETIATKDGPMDVMQGTAPAEARDLVLDRYSHLFPKAQDR